MKITQGISLGDFFFWLFFLKKGQLVAGNSKVWVGTDGLSEVSLSGHKHASTDITISDFVQTLLETTDIDTSLIKLSDKIDVIDDQLNSTENAYIWRKYQQVPAANKGLAAEVYVESFTTSGTYTLQYSNEVAFDENRKVILVDPQTTTVSHNNTDVCEDCYILITGGSLIDNTVYYLKYFKTDLSINEDTGGLSMPLMAYIADVNLTELHFIEDVINNNREAYPDDGLHTDGYYYKYLREIEAGMQSSINQLNIMINAAPKIAFGMYTGNSTATVRLETGFLPKIVILSQNFENRAMSGPVAVASESSVFPNTETYLTMVYTIIRNPSSMNESFYFESSVQYPTYQKYRYYDNIIWDETGVTFTLTSTDPSATYNAAINASGKSYRWVALG